MSFSTPLQRKIGSLKYGSDEPWTVDGASVRVALICFANPEAVKSVALDGNAVDLIFSDLTPQRGHVGTDLSAVGSLDENRGQAFQGIVPRGEVNRREKEARKLPGASFLIPGAEARRMLELPTNPNGKRNIDVIRPYLIGDEITTRLLDRFIVDFREMSEVESALYEAPFAYIAPIKLHRAAMNQPEALQFWWRHWNSRPKMRRALHPLKRYIATPRVAKHRLFVWVPVRYFQIAKSLQLRVPTTRRLVFSTAAFMRCGPCACVRISALEMTRDIHRVRRLRRFRFPMAYTEPAIGHGIRAGVPNS